ncbi:hypothetical protein ACLOJK_032477 [Asimina triloba]
MSGRGERGRDRCIILSLSLQTKKSTVGTSDEDCVTMPACVFRFNSLPSAFPGGASVHRSSGDASYAGREIAVTCSNLVFCFRLFNQSMDFSFQRRMIRQHLRTN